MEFEIYYQEMTNEQLLEDATNDSLLDAYRKKCKQVLLSRLEAQQEIIQL